MGGTWPCRLRGAALAVAAGLSAVGAHPARAAPAWLDAIMAGPPALSGVAAVAVDRRRERDAVAAGRAVIDPADPGRERPMSPDDPVRVASVSKLVTTLGVMRLVEAGVLDLDRDVSDYLGWRLRNPNFPDRPITLRLLLSHRSSLTDDGGYSFPLGVELKDALGPKSWRADAPPGGLFSYTNLNYGVVAAVMESATHERFDRLMTRLVFKPLKMDACYNWSGCSPAAIARAGVIYRKGPDETRWDPAGPWVPQLDDLRGKPPPCLIYRPSPQASCDLSTYRLGANGTLFSPQGGVRISARDLGRLGRLILNRGTLDGVRLLRPASIEAMMTPQWRAGDTPADNTYDGLMRCWGLSLQCLPDADPAGRPRAPGRPLWGHLGDAYGLWSGLWIDPAAGRAYSWVVTGTSDDPDRVAKGATGFKTYEQAIFAGLSHDASR